MNPIGLVLFIGSMVCLIFRLQLGALSILGGVLGSLYFSHLSGVLLFAFAVNDYRLGMMQLYFRASPRIDASSLLLFGVS
jgi:hypothetical protein